MITDSRDAHFDRLIELLELEAEAEQAQILAELQKDSSEAEAEQSGRTLVQLAIVDEQVGLGGRVLLTLAKRNQSLSLPWNRLGVGAPVLLSEQGSEAGQGWRGVVSQRDRQSIEVAFEQWPETEADIFRLDISNDEVARQRQRAALEQVRSAKSGSRLAELRPVLLGQESPRFRPGPADDSAPLDPLLNESQWEAVRLALAAEELAIIHGPPGTGKTTTVVELIRQAVRRGQTVLACAPSNLAVDNIFERLLAAGENAIRLGHPARVLPGLRDYTLDLMIESHTDIRTARKLMREAYALRAQASKYTRARPEPGARRAMRQEAKQMIADARRLEAMTVERILNSATVLCATTTGLREDVLGQRRFDLCVIDEAGQSTEPGVWIPILRSERVVLAGDHLQLPPTIISQRAVDRGFGVSMMERLMAQLGATAARQLTVQYRMHEAIMGFSNREFYAGSLQADDSVARHLLADLAGVAAGPLTEQPVLFVDTAGAGYTEEEEPDGESRLNPQEGLLACRKIADLLAAGVPAEQMAVIAPYSAQVRFLRAHLEDQPGLEIDSVDGFQGREKEVVVLSLVRSNRAGEIGFLGDTRRMNVALTRARRKLIVIGDSATIGAHPFYQQLIDYFESIGAYHSVWEEM